MTALLFLLALLLVGLFAYLAKFSGRLRVEEQRYIDAAPAAVFARVADFAAWQDWNPWQVHEPDAALSPSGEAGKPGTRLAWDTARSGKAMLRQLRSADGLLAQQVDAEQPFRYRGRSEWTFEASGSGTQVTWRFRGRVGFLMRPFAATVRGVIALQFRHGLDRLAQVLENPAAAAAEKHYRIEHVGVVRVPQTRCIYRTYDGPISGVRAAIRTSLAALREDLARSGIAADGPAVVAYARTNIKARTTVCYIGIPIADAGSDGLPVRQLPAHAAFVTRLHGTHDALEVAWFLNMQRLQIENRKPNQGITPFERYVADGDSLPERELITELYSPLLD